MKTPFRIEILFKTEWKELLKFSDSISENAAKEITSDLWNFYFQGHESLRLLDNENSIIATLTGSY